MLVIVGSGSCLALGWWQWTRFQAVSGSYQNLGYALQWPLFAWFFIYAYRKFVRYEQTPPAPPNAGVFAEIPPGVLPQRPPAEQDVCTDPVRREYNTYLAGLAHLATERQNRTTP